MEKSPHVDTADTEKSGIAAPEGFVGLICEIGGRAWLNCVNRLLKLRSLTLEYMESDAANVSVNVFG